mmetsp:Transcript_9878/g.9759  ORF Transcript_9878/g.9759 Transcript_9878/m.9759 type:complete len:100 (+) Transcript_9878:56-355(+)
MLSSLSLLRQPVVQRPSGGLLTCGQQRWKIHLSKSVIWRFYNRLNVRRKYKTAIRRGRMVWKDGQVQFPKIGIAGFDDHKNAYRGKIENCRAPRIWFVD